MLAEVLASQPEIPDHAVSRTVPQSMLEQVENALLTLSHRHLERRQRELRTGIAEAERRGDQNMVETLTLEKMKIDRTLREQ